MKAIHRLRQSLRHETMNGLKRYGPSGDLRTSGEVSTWFAQQASPFPSRRPSPLGSWALPTSRTAGHRGRFVCMGRPLLCCPEGTSENSPAFQLRSDKPTRANPVNVELCESSGAAGCLMRLGVSSFSKPSVVHEPGLLSFVLLAAALLGPVDGIQAADQDWPVYLGDKASSFR